MIWSLFLNGVKLFETVKIFTITKYFELLSLQLVILTNKEKISEQIFFFFFFKQRF